MQIIAHNKTQIEKKLDDIKYPAVVSVSEGNIRSVLSNRRYWGVVVKAIQQHAKDQGLSYSKESLHEFLKQEKYGKKLIEINGHVQQVAARSSKMTDKQFSEFMEWAEAYAMTELNVPFEYFNDEQDY